MSKVRIVTVLRWALCILYHASCQLITTVADLASAQSLRPLSLKDAPDFVSMLKLMMIPGIQSAALHYLSLPRRLETRPIFNAPTVQEPAASPKQAQHLLKLYNKTCRKKERQDSCQHQIILWSVASLLSVPAASQGVRNIALSRRLDISRGPRRKPGNAFRPLSKPPNLRFAPNHQLQDLARVGHEFRLLFEVTCAHPRCTSKGEEKQEKRHSPYLIYVS